FLRTWAERPLQIGAIQPSGPALARAMASYVDPSASGPVIEIGPGTGPVTAALLRRGVPAERLVLLEFGAEFCALLRRRHPAARVIEGDAYGIAKTLAPLRLAPAAAVVSSLPLLTRPVLARLDLLRQCFDLMAQGAPFVQFTYATTAPIPRSGQDYTATPSRRIWLNVPPARVWVYRRFVK
ncbi:MAG: phospholipid methyltransferase, partial [Hyphomicrobiales bacterium]|nr:phospholipid methyltransferase [Hyphomicrobiales bacterium]